MPYSQPDHTVPQPSEPAAAAGAAPPGTADRYELQGVLARGGMGEIHEARDALLNRRVAVKVIQPRFASDAAIVRRFLDEAQITGQLQHLGVPPVHDLGTLPDGRPFLVMKLIRGQTLSDMLRERPASVPERMRVIQVFEQICQTVAYAHSRNVIHRDLKPANVMIGAFGEVQVMDWGLAKVLTGSEGAGAEEPAAADTGVASEIEVSRASDPLTRAGSSFGTPQYMPPEQAQGEWAAVGPRADVFALGGILCEVLTGHPPYTGKTAEVRARAVLGNVAEALARLDACGAEPELIDLAKQCLAPDPAGRPADGKAVADRVAAFREGVELRVERERLARNADAVGSLLRQCEAALQNDEAANAAFLLEQAERRVADGADGFEARVARARADLATLQELDRIEDLRWTVSDNKLTPRAVIAAAWGEAFRRHGIVPEVTPTADAGRLLRESVIGRRLLATLDLWFACAPSGDLLALLCATDPDAYRCEVRAAIQGRDARLLTDLAGLPAALQQSPQFAIVLSEQESVDPARRRQILRGAHGRQPDSLLVLMALAAPGAAPAPEGVVERIGWYRAALAIRPKNAAVWNNLGITLRQHGDLDGAVEAYRQAARFAPADATVRYNLGIALHAKGALAPAEESYREAIKLEPGYAKAYSNLGLVLHDLGAAERAAEAYRRAIACDPSFARAHYNLGNALARQGALDAALAAYREAIRLDPEYAPAHNNLGIALQKKGDLGAAVEAIREAIRRDPGDAAALRSLAAVLEKKGDLAGAVAAYQEATARDGTDAVTFFWLGLLLDRQGKATESRAAFRRAGKLDKRYAKCATGSRVEILKALNFTQ